ncbi:MAG: tetratricopeptide repeat protein [Chloroflexi bacterium]|nr:tetratricopeptide repeat protein [Chloroflexota bacterium]
MHDTVTKPPLPPAVLPPDGEESSRKFIADRYEVINKLVGGMGLVYLCRDHLTSSLVALKTFKPEYLSNRAARDLFLREGTMWVELGQHPHIVQAYRVERIGDGREIYLVLEWIVQPEGKSSPSLRSWLRPGQPLPVEQAVSIALGVARGMKYATKKIPNLVHRDLKPENILMGYDEAARVTDFGLASTLSELKPGQTGTLSNKKENFGRTQLTQGVAGTPLYMAPEQWEHEALDERADIYALGCILYEMVNGRFAAEGETREELREIHLNNSIKPPDATIPRPVLEVLRHSLMAKREHRYRSWAEMETGLIGAYTRLTGKPAPPEREIERETAVDRLIAGQSYNTMGLSYLDIGKLDVAVLYFEQAVNIARAEGSLELEGVGLGNLGLAYTALGYLDRAIEFHEEHLGIARETGNMVQEGLALGNLGRVYRQNGRPEQAINLHERELTIAQKQADRYKEATALHSLGETYRQLGQTDEAIYYYRQSLGIARDIGDKARVERILNSMGKFYLDSGETRESVALFKQTLDLARQIGDRVGEGEALGNLGDLYRVSARTDRAAEYYAHALNITQESNDRRRMIRNLMRLGDLYLEMNQPAMAQEYFERALLSAQEINGRVEEMKAYEKLGDVYSRLGNVTEATKMYKSALRRVEDLGYKSTRKQQILISLAQAYAAWGDTGRAVDYLITSRQISEEADDWVKIKWHWNEIATLNTKAKLYRTAEEAYNSLLALARERENIATQIETLANLGEVYGYMRDSAKSTKSYKEALDLARSHKNLVGEANTLAKMGLTYQALGKKRQAISSLEKSVEIAKKSKRGSSVAANSFKLAQVLGKQGKWQKARPHAELALKLYTRFGDKVGQRRTENMLRLIEKNKGKTTGLFNIPNLRG